MIPHKDLEQLIQYYKGELTENTLLNKAATISRQKTCVVSRPPTPSSPRQCPNQTVESRINQVNQTHPSISGRRGCGGTGWTPRRGSRRGRGFGDGTRGTMVEAHDKRQPVEPQTPPLHRRPRMAKRPPLAKFLSRKGVLPPVEETISVVV